MKTTMTSVLAAACLAAGPGAVAAPPTVRAPELPIGATWNVIQLARETPGTFASDRWESKTYWDLRPPAGSGRMIQRVVMRPGEAGLGSVAGRHGADRALCSLELESLTL